MEKFSRNWMFRKNEEDMIKNSARNQLYKFLKNELQLLELKIRKESGDNDKQETELDDDAVNYKFMHMDMKKRKEQ